MSADFWAGYVSGAVSILVGNPLDLIKTRLQAVGQHINPDSATPSTGSNAVPSTTSSRIHNGSNPLPLRSLPTSTNPVVAIDRWTSFARGAAAPILGYGALNALLFVTYNRSLALLNPGLGEAGDDRAPAAWSIWTAGALGGLATFVVSAPTELVKCRAQVSSPPQSSWAVVRNIWTTAGFRGLYLGGTTTALRDAVGYGFYFWSYELSKNALAKETDTSREEAMKVLLCGGFAGVVTWASIFPLDVIKTRMQTWEPGRNLIATFEGDRRPLLSQQDQTQNNSKNASTSAASASTQTPSRPSAWQIAHHAYRTEGLRVFFRGLGVCSVRAFIVNAVQWTIYEWMMKVLTL